MDALYKIIIGILLVVLFSIGFISDRNYFQKKYEKAKRGESMSMLERYSRCLEIFNGE